jgi:hypothetical protein
MSISDTLRYIGEKDSIIDDEDPKVKRVPAAEAMIVERKGIYCVRLGWASIYMDSWADLHTLFETILLA